MTKHNTFNRRDFFKQGTSIVLGAGAALKSAGRANAAAPDKSTVVAVTHSSSVGEGRKIDQAAVREMLNRGAKALTGSESPWSRFLKPQDRVGLKINTLGRPMLFTHHELINAMIEELKEFGVKENRIIVWDRFERHMSDCRFEFNTTSEGVRCFGTETADSEGDRFDPRMIYRSDFDDPEKREKGGTTSRLSSIFTQECDKIINLAVLKDHGYSGVTLALKNLAYGITDNNSRFHGPRHIGPFIADICALPVVMEKTVLHIIDGLEGCYDSGPVPRNPRAFFTPQSIWMGTDPVALDAVGFQVINRERKKRGVPPLEETGRPIDHIELAAGKGVGKNRIEDIDLNEIILSG